MYYCQVLVAVRVVVAKLVILGVVFLTSVILKLSAAVVAKLVILGISSLILSILVFKSSISS